MNIALYAHKYNLTGALIVHEQYNLETQTGMVTGMLLYLYACNCKQGPSHRAPLKTVLYCVAV
jgi:hypothetical protein